MSKFSYTSECRWVHSKARHCSQCGASGVSLMKSQTKDRYTRRWKDEPERSRSAIKGQLTRAKRRISKGVCPCCNRTFQNLANHISEKHPDYSEQSMNLIPDDIAERFILADLLGKSIVEIQAIKRIKTNYFTHASLSQSEEQELLKILNHNKHQIIRMNKSKGEEHMEASQEQANVNHDLEAEFKGLAVEGKLNGDVPEEQKTFLKRYLRMRILKEVEISLLKSNFEVAKKRLDSELAAIEYQFGDSARNIAKELLKGGKKKSLKTLWGTFGFRKKAAALIIKKTEDCLQSLMSKAPQLVKKKVEVSIDKAGLNELWKENGWIPGGCDVQEEKEIFFVKGE